MSSPNEHPIYPTALRMVLWGEKREDVLYTLQVNGISGPEADDFYQELLDERIASIKAAYWAKARAGLLWLAISGGILAIGIFALGGVRILPFACVAGLVVGLWKSFEGFAGILLASKNQWPVEDEI